MLKVGLQLDDLSYLPLRKLNQGTFSVFHSVLRLQKSIKNFEDNSGQIWDIMKQFTFDISSLLTAIEYQTSRNYWYDWIAMLWELDIYRWDAAIFKKYATLLDAKSCWRSEGNYGLPWKAFQADKCRYVNIFTMLRVNKSQDL